jgi:hypothetical protein
MLGFQEQYTACELPHPVRGDESYGRSGNGACKGSHKTEWL